MTAAVDRPPLGERTALIAGGGGFIGGHLAAALLADGWGAVRVVDVKPREEWFQLHDGADNRQLDLRRREAADTACEGVTDVFNLAADMGGMGFIERFKAECMLNVLINTHLLAAARERGVQRYFFASSACVYAADKQRSSQPTPLAEADAYPAMPEDGYGWEKLFSERMCRHFTEDYGLTTRVARFHNAYGPHGSWDGGREKAPAAICRKVAAAELEGTNTIEIWGDGTQARSFMAIDDCVAGIRRVHEGHVAEPVNVGSAELVTIDELVTIVEEIAGVTLERRYVPDAPRGVQGRSSDNTFIRAELGWEPATSLREGLAPTYAWIREQLVAARS